MRRASWLALLALGTGCDAAIGADGPLPAVSTAPATRAVSAFGRLEPEDGIRRISGPSGAPSVIADLRVDEGDAVEKGQVLAVLDTEPMRRANRERWKAELANAKRELARHSELNTNRVVSDSSREEWETRVRVAEAELARARAELSRAYVRSPIDGRVLYVHAREGEQVGSDGILELGRTDAMFAVAEVYEDDVARVRVGQRARVRSPALPDDLSGTVDWIHLKVAKQDALGTDPAARKDARVVEVEIRLDDSAPAAALTNLQVEIEIEPGEREP
ncbi:MAG: efflux RND transporter periplasmic adaptor subunit [Myxococcota bacterium]